MSLPILAAEIARRVPDMVKDSPTNNAQLIENLIREELRNTAVPLGIDACEQQELRITLEELFLMGVKQ